MNYWGLIWNIGNVSAYTLHGLKLFSPPTSSEKVRVRSISYIKLNESDGQKKLGFNFEVFFWGGIFQTGIKGKKQGS